MSTIQTIDTPCAVCGASLSVPLATNVNAQRRPDHRAAILDGSLQALSCPACGAANRVEPELSYLDQPRGQWILVEPYGRRGEWAALEEAAVAIFSRHFGPSAPPAAAAIGAELEPRVVFGWSALREKLWCRAADVDEASLELLKLVTLRARGGPLSDDLELRLVLADAEGLELAWIEEPGELEQERLRLPRALLAELEGPDWDELRDTLNAGLYLDLHRLVLPT